MCGRGEAGRGRKWRRVAKRRCRNGWRRGPEEGGRVGAGRVRRNGARGGEEDRTGRGRMRCVCVSGRVGRSVRVGMAGSLWVLVHTYAKVCGKSVHQCAHVCTRFHTCARVFTRVHLCSHVCTRVHSCSHVCTRVHTCAQMAHALGWVLCLCSVGSYACTRRGHGAVCVC